MLQTIGTSNNNADGAITFTLGASQGSNVSLEPSNMRQSDCEYFSFNKIGDIDLKKPLIVSVELIDGFFEARNSELDIFEAAENKEKALAAFQDFFREELAIWERVTDAELTQKAQELRNKFLEYI
jgi:hypothetical protein